MELFTLFRIYVAFRLKVREHLHFIDPSWETNIYVLKMKLNLDIV